MNNKKLRELENKVFQLPTELHTTEIDLRSLSEAEQALIIHAAKIAEFHSEKELLPLQETVLDNALRVLSFRYFDCITTFLEGYLCKGNEGAKVTLHTRFLWFINELREEIRQSLEADRVEAEANPKDPVDRIDEYFKTQREVFTRDTYDNLQSRMFMEVMALQTIKGAKERSHDGLVI